MPEPPDTQEICAIITTYRPTQTIVKCVQYILPQVGEIVIVDDGDSRDNVAKLDAWFSGIPRITIYHQPENLGIAAALNRGSELARTKGYKWLLTLDDDTIPYSDMVERLCWHMAQLQSRTKIGAIGMSWDRKNTTTAEARLPRWREKRGIVTSGSLFSLEAYDTVGGFREGFFIDCVDYDFCLRLRERGYRIIQVLECGFAHSLGVSRQYRFLRFTVDTYSHEPQRLYYLFRNATVLASEYVFKDPLYVCAVGIGFVKEIAAVVLWQPQKRLRLRALLMGISDALRGRMGRRILSDDRSTK